ncbi:proteasome component ECM29 [Mytilus galloprovincialis]|uniref:Proteasome component ECM29 n=1 Tax=Mytilus galloprovincialis TaxID=29158 RepID=A0A8B6CF95_MYTGA|nr:proteasome component ECM29 [Mytilus galloprovincialis]
MTDESSLIERVFLRIGSAETDDQLQTALAKFLTPVILKLNSGDEAVRKKVMELLVHINKRLKSLNKVQLPVESLITQYLDPSASSIITNFSIIYIRMGYPRLEPAKQAELVPLLIKCLDGKPNTQQDSILHLMMPALEHVKMPQDDKQKQQIFGLTEKPLIVKVMLDYMMDILLLPYNAHISTPTQTRPSTAPAGGPGPTTTLPPPGLSEYSKRKVLGDSPLNPEALEKAKIGVLKFLGSGLIEEKMMIASDTRHSIIRYKTKVFHYVIASSDTRQVWHHVIASSDTRHSIIRYKTKVFHYVIASSDTRQVWHHVIASSDTRQHHQLQDIGMALCQSIIRYKTKVCHYVIASSYTRHRYDMSQNTMSLCHQIQDIGISLCHSIISYKKQHHQIQDIGMALCQSIIRYKTKVCHYVIASSYTRHRYDMSQNTRYRYVILSASSDTRHSVATAADLELKRITGSVDWNSLDILNKLYTIFQGTIDIKGKVVSRSLTLKIHNIEHISRKRRSVTTSNGKRTDLIQLTIF